MIESGRDEIWYFIAEEVLYVSYNISLKRSPTESGQGSSSPEPPPGGFMGGAANPAMMVQGLSLDSETESAILSLFDENTSFSVSFDGRTAYSEFSAGPGALEAIVSLALGMQ